MRFKYALRNLYISQALIFIFLIFAYFLWFPHSFEKLGGFYKTAWMLIFIDLVLGPALVFFIYNENKKYLRFDINVLLGIQLTAFIFGAYSLFLKHPAYAVFSIDRFVLTNVSNIYPQPSLLDQVKQHFLSSPKFVIAQLPNDTEERNSLTFNVIFNAQPDIESRPKYFSPLDKHVKLIMKKSVQLSQLALNSEDVEKLRLFILRHKKKQNQYAFFPLMGNNKKGMIWVFDKNTARPVEILDINPWKIKVATNLND